MIWIHLLIPPQMLKMSNGHVTQEQLSKSSRLPKILDSLIPAGPQSHLRRVRGCARAILVCTGVPSPLTVKQGHPLTCPLPFHPKRKKTFYTIPGSTPV